MSASPWRAPGRRRATVPKGVNGRVLNTITPETATTCMYFWSLMRNYKLRDQSLTTQLREANANIFVEDQVVVEAQQIAINERPGVPLRNLNIDAGSTRARKIIDDMIVTRRGPPSPNDGPFRNKITLPRRPQLAIDRHLRLTLFVRKEKRRSGGSCQWQ